MYFACIYYYMLNVPKEYIKSVVVITSLITNYSHYYKKPREQMHDYIKIY